MLAISRFIYFKILKWRITGNIDFSKHQIKKAVIIGAPHTSWHDFYIALLLRKIAGLKINFVAKKELFIWPFSIYLKALGGRPIDRFSNQDKVSAIAELFNQNEEFRLGLAPEGTRKKVDSWKSGFYYIALKANVPILMFTLDFKNKVNNISEPFYPTGNYEKDIAFIQSFYKGVLGKVKKYS